MMIANGVGWIVMGAFALLGAVIAAHEDEPVPFFGLGFIGLGMEAWGIVTICLA